MGLIVVSLNVDSIVYSGRRNLLIEFLNKNRVDICLAQETKLDNNIKFKIPGYNIIRNGDKRGKCGTAILIKDNIRIRRPSFFKDLFQSTSMEFLFNNQWHGISSCYFPPGLNANLETFKKFFNNHQSRLMGGDFNGRHTKFNDFSNNIYGVFLCQMIDQFDMISLNPPTPTCYRSFNGSHIDKFIGHGSPLTTSNIKVIPSFSDHAGILIQIHGENNQIPPSITYNFDKIRIEKFNKFMDLNIGGVALPTTTNLSPSQIDEIMDGVNSLLNTAITRYVPIAKNTGQNRVILSAITRSLQTHCKRLQRILYRNGNNMQPFTKNQIINRIRLLKSMIRNACAHDTGIYYSNLYNNIESTGDAFKIIKNFSGHKKRETMSGSIYTNDERTNLIAGHTNIANALGDQFIKNHKLTTDTYSNHQTEVDDAILFLNNTTVKIDFNDQISPIIRDDCELANTNEKLRIHQTNILTSANEVGEIIKERPNKKSSGIDNVPYTTLKNFSPLLILFLTTLFNHMLAIGYFPNCWKRALVSAIPKPGKNTSIISNWRPISQLCCISKIFEKVIARRLGKIIRELPILQNQFGFLPGHSTEQALAKIQNEINNGLNNKRITSILALDLKAAFDVVWHDGLIFKMIKLEINPFLIKMIQSFLANRSFSIRLNGFISRVFEMDSGTPQGSVISPSLFNIYMYDIPLHNHIKLTQFADDTTLHYTHRRPTIAQNYFNAYLFRLSEYFENWKLVLSEQKTEFINIMGLVKDTKARLRKNSRNMKMQINGTQIKHSNNIRLLGVQFQTNNRFTKNIKIRINKARKAKASLNRILRNSTIDKKIKTNIYKIYIRPILMYGAPTWCLPPSVSSHQMELLRTFERGCLRSTANIRRDIGSFKHIKIQRIYDESGCIRIDRFIMQRHINFYNRCKHSGNIKFKYGNNSTNRQNGPYNHISHLFDLNERGLLLANENLLLFHRRYNNQPGTVYNTGQ